MMKSVFAFAFLMLAATALAWPAFAPKLKASEPAPLAKQDRLSVQPTMTDCSRQVWPSIEDACLKNGRLKVRRIEG